MGDEKPLPVMFAHDREEYIHTVNQKGKCMIAGNITINGIDDKQLRTMLTVKIEHEQVLVFNPNQLQPINTQRPQPHQPGQPPKPPMQEQRYNNAVLAWNGEEGLKAVKELLDRLTNHNGHHEQAG